MAFVLQFCSWSACRMKRMSSARAITGLAAYFGSTIFHSMFMKFSVIAEVVVGIDVRESHAVPVRHGRDGGHLADQALDLQQPAGGVVNVLRIRIHRGQRRHRAHEHRHGVGVVAEALHELLGGLMEHGVVRDVVHPTLQLALAWAVRRTEAGRRLRETCSARREPRWDSRGSAGFPGRRQCR